MANLGFTLNVEEHDLPFDTTPLPAGEYLACIKSDEIKTSKAGNEMLTITWQVIDNNGPHDGRLLWQNLNIWHPGETTRKIARSELAGIGAACGLPAFDDTVELFGIPVLLNVLYKSNEGTSYPPGNEVKGCKPAQGAVAPRQAAAPQRPVTNAAPRQAAVGTGPWKRQA